MLGKRGNNVGDEEDFGVFPKLESSSVIKNKRVHTYTGTIMQEMSAQLQHHKPMDLYNKLTLKHNFLDLHVVVGNKCMTKTKS